MLHISYSNNMLGFLPKVGSGRLITTGWEICAKNKIRYNPACGAVNGNRFHRCKPSPCPLCSDLI